MIAFESEKYGFHYRSWLERKWATFFHSLGFTFDYEPEGFLLSNGMGYRPDFLLDNDIWSEIKPTYQEYRREFEKLSQFVIDTIQKKLGPDDYLVGAKTLYVLIGSPGSELIKEISIHIDIGREGKSDLEVEDMFGGKGYRLISQCGNSITGCPLWLVERTKPQKHSWGTWFWLAIGCQMPWALDSLSKKKWSGPGWSKPEPAYSKIQSAYMAARAERYQFEALNV